ncbi:MAG: primase alpha helix C-terminal domain-containing protein [Arcobacteraceae bacterium]|nr:primase alpha helix C-terminal domain-containing protein [Arcobacteraceae bacterium]
MVIEQNNETIIEFHKILQDKLYLENIQSCNTKDQLNYYIKPKNKLEALHDKFIKYGTNRATSFVIIDIDNINKTIQNYTKDITYKLNGYEPSWITKTDKGFHVGFILEKPLWLNDDIQKKKVEEIKRDLTLLLNGDIAGSHRLIGYWRNPIRHESIINLKLHDIDKLQEIATNQYFESFSLFDEQTINNTKFENRGKNKKELSKSNWEQIDKTGFIKGNRNSFLFNKIIGMLYNGLITNNQILATLNNLNQNELEPSEINTIAKSILKYEIKPNTNKIKIEKRIKGIYHQELWDNNIHNYKKKNKTVFARQKIGQKISTAKIIQSTVEKLIKGYQQTYINHELFINRNIEKNSNVKKRTIQRYRNERELEDTIKTEAFKRYLQGLAPKDVMANDTPIRNIVNLAIKWIEFHYEKNSKVFKFTLDVDGRLIFYDLEGCGVGMAA